MNLTTLAVRLLSAHRALARASRPIDRRIAGARLDGMCDAAHALGVGMTPAAVRIATADTVNGSGQRPAFEAAHNRAQKQFDAECAAALVARLEAL